MSNNWPNFCDQFVQILGIFKHMITLDVKFSSLPAGLFIFIFHFLFFSSLALESIYHTWDGGTDHRACLVSHPTQCVAVQGGHH